MRQMKLLTLMVLILAISAQPLAAGGCAVDMDQGETSVMEMPMGADMDHGDDHDCCDPQSDDSDPSCDGGAHCGMCTAVTPLLPASLKVNGPWHSDYAFVTDDGRLLPSHASPPFRPPIS